MAVTFKVFYGAFSVPVEVRTGCVVGFVKGPSTALKAEQLCFHVFYILMLHVRFEEILFAKTNETCKGYWDWE